MTTETRQLDTTELALEPDREFHFETGRALAERLGYPPPTSTASPPQQSTRSPLPGRRLRFAAVGEA